MDKDTQNTFKMLIKKFFEQPLWIKHVIYLELKEEFESSSAKNCLNSISKDNSLQLYTPKITFIGKRELETKSKGLPQETYNFLEGAFNKLSIIEISIDNYWNLAECSTHFINA